MATAPTVQDLSDLIAQYTNADAPQQAQIDSEVTANDASGTAQTAGLDQAKTNAFGSIAQAANDRGGYFSGFTPDQEASYTGSTYLPALAKLQTTIAATKSQLLGQKATIASQDNTEALNEQKTEQSSLDAWNQDQADQEAQAAAAAAAAANTDKEDELDRESSASIAATTAAAKSAPAATFSYKNGQNAGSGFNFTTAAGQPISAKTYAALTGTTLAAQIQAMASAGDTGAQDYLKNGSKSKYATALTW